jgi:hypothetical protein
MTAERLEPSAPQLADVLPSVLAALGDPSGADPLGLVASHGPLRQAVVLLVDGLGYHLLPEAAKSSPELAGFVHDRHVPVLRLSAPFPTTTPTSLVTLGTGQPPGAHGVLGFVVRRPGTDRLLTHISWRDDPPQAWQPRPRLLAAAAAAGISTVVVSDPAFAGSGLTRAAYGDARYRGTRPGRSTAAAMAAELAAGTQLVLGYHAALDTAMHVHGIASRQWRAEAKRVGRLITSVAAALPPGAALFVTADHGGLDVPADGRFDLARDDRLAAGVALVAGEPRVRYLHPVPGAVDDVAAAWQEALGAAAGVHVREELVEAGWFGPVVPEHLERIGELVVVCHEPIAILASGHEPASLATLVGFHGSITPAERDVPLLVLRPDLPVPS